MGGGGKGGGGGSSTTVATPWSGVQPYLTSAYEQLSAAHGAGPPEYFPGSTVAPTDPATTAALDRMQGRAETGSPLVAASQDQLTRTMAGDYLSDGNPYFQRAVDAAARPLQQRYEEQVLPGIDARFSQAGRTGSGAHGTAVGRAYGDYLNSVADMSGNLAYRNYGDERNRQVQGMLFAPQLAQQDYADLERLGYVGGVREQYGQNDIDAALQRWNYEQRAPFDWTSEYIANLQSAPWNQSTSTSGGGGSPFLQGLGGVGSLLGGVGSLFA